MHILISGWFKKYETTWNHIFWWLIQPVSMSTFGSPKKTHQESRPSAPTARLHGIAAVEPSPLSAAVLAHGPVSSWSHSLIHHLSFHGVIQRENVQETIVFTLKYHEISKFPTTITQFWGILGGLVFGFKSAGNCGFIIQICGFLWRMDRTDPLWQLQGGCWNGSSVHFTQLLVGKHIEIPLTKSKCSHDAKVLNQNLPGWQVNHT